MWVTAVEMDCITESSGHTMTPCAVSVCTTPAAPSPLPIPYPPVASAAEGSKDAPSRTKMGGAKIITVGACFKACHGNEPGTLKEVVSAQHRRAGVRRDGRAHRPRGARDGAASRGAPASSTRGAEPWRRHRHRTQRPRRGCARASPSSAGGGGGGDGDGNGNGGKDGAGGGGSGEGEGGEGAEKDAAGAEGQGDPVDVVTGRMYMEVQDFAFPGPMPLRFCRTYNSRRGDRDVGLGFGWTHRFAWSARVGRRSIEIVDAEGLSIRHDAKLVAAGAPSVDDRGNKLVRLPGQDGDVYELSDAEGGTTRCFRAGSDPSTAWMVEERDRNGNAIKLERDPAGRLVALIDSAGRRIDVGSDRRGRVASMRFFSPRRSATTVLVEYAYDEEGDLVSATDPAGYARRYGYEEHLLVRHELKTGLTYFWRYDMRSPTRRCLETWGEYPGRIDPALAVPIPPAPPGKRDARRLKGIFHCRFEYDPEMRYTEVVDARGGLWRYEGNDRGLVTKTVDPKGGVTTRVFDDHGRIIAVEHPDGSVTRWKRDDRGRPEVVIDPFGRETLYERDERGSVVRNVGPDGAELRMEYDGRCNLVGVHHPDGTSETRRYDARGLVVSVLDRGGGTWRNEHDAQGNLVKRTAPDGVVTTVEYDDFGRWAAHVDALGNETRWEYDARGDVITTVYPDGATERRAYDPEGSMTLFEQVGGRVDRFEYAGHGWLVAITDPLGRVERYAYDPMGIPVRAQNPAGEVYTRELDRKGNAVSIATFDGRRHAFDYDVASRCVTAWRAAGPTRFEYDGFDRRVKTELSDGQVCEYTWGPRGSLVGTSAGNLARELDAMGRIVSESTDAGLVEREYDASGRLARIRSSAGADVALRWGAAGRLAGVGLSGADVAIQRDAAGRTREVALGDRIRVRSTYGVTGRLTEQVAEDTGSPGKVLAGTRWGFDAGDCLHDTWSALWGPTVIEHDGAFQVRRVTAYDLAAKSVVRDEVFAYSARGGPIEVSPAGEERAYRPGGRVLRRKDATYAYDDDGRMIEKRVEKPDAALTWRYHWSDADELVAVDTPEGRVELAYDGLSRRVSKTVKGLDGATLETVEYLWVNDVLLNEVSSRRGAVTYAFDPESLAPIALHDGSSAYAVLADDLGTVHDLVGADGRVAWSARRDAYGRIVDVRGDRALQPFRFAGQIEDPETGLFYNRYRYYDPELGHYLSPDPLGPTAGLNELLYTPDPFGEIDPLGLAARRSRSPQGPDETDGQFASRVGPCAPARGGYIPWSSSSQSFPGWLHDDIDALGAANGCHTCGKKPGDAGFVKAPGAHNFTPDHQPPVSLHDGTGGYRLYPQCGLHSPQGGGSAGHQAAAGVTRRGYRT